MAVLFNSRSTVTLQANLENFCENSEKKSVCVLKSLRIGVKMTSLDPAPNKTWELSLYELQRKPQEVITDSTEIAIVFPVETTSK